MPEPTRPAGRRGDRNDGGAVVANREDVPAGARVHLLTRSYGLGVGISGSEITARYFAGIGFRSAEEPESLVFFQNFLQTSN
jgi:hypothetical protein